MQQLVVSYDQAQAHKVAVDAQLAAVTTHLAADRRAEIRATGVLRQLALNSYMTGSDDDATLALFDADDNPAQASKQEYMQVASDRLASAVDAVNTDRLKTQSARTELRAEQAQAEADVQKLASARQAAQAALATDDALLSQAQNNLQAALGAAAEQREEAEEEEEEAMAAKAAAAKAAQAAAASQAPPPGSVTINPSPGSYVNPLRGINGLTPERIDQGVDYSGYGPIYAIGDGVVLSTVNSGLARRHLHHLPPE